MRGRGVQPDPLVTVVVPVCRTPEPLLYACLASLCAQDFERLEILIVDDNGMRSEQNACDRAVKNFIRKHSCIRHTNDIRIVCHGKNRGLAAARRTGFENARGAYCLMVDSDDILAAENAVSRLYQTAMAAPDGNTSGMSGAFDIVQCGCVLTGSDESILARMRSEMAVIEFPEPETVVAEQGTLAPVFFGGRDVPLFLWGKLLKTEAVLDSLSGVPEMFCILAEDLLLLYFISRGTHRYICIPDRLYVYSVDTGLTSGTEITDLLRWERLCSVSGVFTAILYDLQERPFPPDSPVPDVLKKTYFEHITRCAFALEHQVAAPLYVQARETFIEAWGKDPALKAIEAVRRAEAPAEH